jgi:hypothetical protein
LEVRLHPGAQVFEPVLIGYHSHQRLLLVTLTAVTVVMQVKTLRPGLLDGYKSFIFAYGTVVVAPLANQTFRTSLALTGSRSGWVTRGAVGLVTIRPTFFSWCHVGVYPSVIISWPTDLLPAHVGLKVPLSMEGYHNGEKNGASGTWFCQWMVVDACSLGGLQVLKTCRAVAILLMLLIRFSRDSILSDGTYFEYLYYVQNAILWAMSRIRNFCVCPGAV